MPDDPTFKPVAADAEASQAAEESKPGAEPAKGDEDAEAIEHEGKKYLPLHVLHKIRQEGKDAKAKIEQYEQWIHKAQAYMDALAQHQPPAEEGPGEKPAAPSPDEAEATQLAKLLDLYDAHAKPDVAKARQVLKVVETLASKQAETAIKPWAEATAQDRSVQNFHMALQVKSKDGRTPSRETLTQMWKTMPVEYTADRRTAQVLAYAALGYDVTQMDAPPARPGEPLETESLGPHRKSDALTDLDKRIAALRGLKPEEYKERTKGFVEGGPSVLEE